MKRRLIAIAACLHLVLVGLGAAHVHLWNWGPVGRTLDRYGLLSGAGSNYPFFAPEVGTTIRAQFDLYAADGKSLGTDDLMRSSTRETKLRLSDIVEMIDEDLENQQTRRLLGASWAAKMFARHPGAAKLTLRVDVFDVPTMSEYRSGERYDWENVYRATFARNRSVNRVAAN
jgi:hypothetical protein